MPAARRLSPVLVLMTCAALAFTASAAHAQMGFEPTPHAPTPAPLQIGTGDASVSPALSLDAVGQGLPLQLGASLAAYRWFEMAMGQAGLRQVPAASLAQRRVMRLTWWKKQS